MEIEGKNRDRIKGCQNNIHEEVPKGWGTYISLPNAPPGVEICWSEQWKRRISLMRIKPRTSAMT
jgi:hypothetical protein